MIDFTLLKLAAVDINYDEILTFSDLRGQHEV